MTTNAPAGAEIILQLVALFATVATIWILLPAIKNVEADRFATHETLLILLFVIIPFVMLIYFGLAIGICNEMVAGSRGQKLPAELSLRNSMPAAVTYIGGSAWVYFRWRKG